MKLTFIITALISSIFLLCGCKKHELTTVVQVKDGKVEGFLENDTKIFKGIPFAAPPVGDLRWKAPQPVKSWEGILETKKFKPACPQPQELEQSEDCLYLNVWTPAKSSDEKLPVMVWIHGGGFALGAPLESTYNGIKLTHKGVLFVTVAYRLGILGFMAHPELSNESPNNVSGNYGLLDQIAALKWVQNNISAFGGDPENVTIFGESAGGISVSMLCASPLAKGLFKGAISQSGGNFGPVYNTDGRKHDGIPGIKATEKLGMEFTQKMGCNSIAELRKMDPQKWMDDPLANMGGFWPVADGYVIPDDQYKLYEAGQYNDVNVIIGTNSDEGITFARPVDPEIYKINIRSQFGDYAEKILLEYPGNTLAETQTSAADIFRETVFAWPSWSWARLQSRTGNSKIFTYYFNQQQPRIPGVSIKPRGAEHAAEIKYVFKNLNDEVFDAADIKLSDILATYWTNFAKYGDPNGANLPVWPEFTENSPATLYFNSLIESGPVPNLDKLQLMEAYFKYRREEGQKPQ